MSRRIHRLSRLAATLLAFGFLFAGTGCAPLGGTDAGLSDDADTSGGAAGGVDGGAAGGDTDGGSGGSVPGESGEIGELPGCDSLIPELEVHEQFSPEFETWAGPDEETKQLQLATWLGPTALDAYAAATEVRHCYWGISLSDVSVSTFTAVLPEATQAELISSLRQSHYVEVPGNEATLFTHTKDDGTWRQTNWYGFTGDVWVASFGYGDRAPVDVILKNLREQFPDWKPIAP